MLKFCVGSNSETKVKFAAETLNVWATMGIGALIFPETEVNVRWRENKEAPVQRYHEAMLSLVMLTFTVVSAQSQKN